VVTRPDAAAISLLYYTANRETSLKTGGRAAFVLQRASKIKRPVPGRGLDTLLFIGVFVSFLFFIASDSMLYFKLFTEIHNT